MNTQICSGCGSQMAAGARFCTVCGKPAAQQSSADNINTETEGFCRSCGAPLVKGAAFCSRCRSQTGKAPVTRNIAPQTAAAVRPAVRRLIPGMRALRTPGAQSVGELNGIVSAVRKPMLGGILAGTGIGGITLASLFVLPSWLRLILSFIVAAASFTSILYLKIRGREQK